MGYQIYSDTDRDKRLMAMGQMAASLAHEIRNPLGSMELFCTLLKKDLTDQPTLLQLADQIHSGILTVNHIITNCLQFAREVNVNKKQISNLEEFLSGCLSALTAKSEQGKVELRIEHNAQGAVWLDSYLMKQVVINLGANAIDAAAERMQREPGYQGVVRFISDFSDAQIWHLHVADNGPGMPQQIVEHIFEPFFSTKKAGTGLGLAIVHNLVLAHGGRIGINNNDQGGCTISVCVPYK
ncbi:MAG: HAMP domain-containing histidine kinase [Deltaproteobacteria bacterium]|nr:HAMP domain-containing histidine kinase [Deltaproteobacteria bacterium]